MRTRKRISDRTLAAAALLALGKIPYEHAKMMGETNFLSLWVRDHNILHSSEHPDRDEFWNLTPMLLAEHREKTKRDIKIIAKSRRIRKQVCGRHHGSETQCATATAAPGQPLAETHSMDAGRPFRKLRSRGFDKRYKRRFDGTVVKR
jgi:hypothetical protein